jgi:hypothetical protein
VIPAQAGRGFRSIPNSRSGVSGRESERSDAGLIIISKSPVHVKLPGHFREPQAGRGLMVVPEQEVIMCENGPIKSSSEHMITSCGSRRVLFLSIALFFRMDFPPFEIVYLKLAKSPIHAQPKQNIKGHSYWLRKHQIGKTVESKLE